MTKPLYEMANNYSQLKVILDNIEDDEIDAESINSLLETMTSDLKSKGVDIAAVIKNIEALSDGIKLIEKNLKERRNKIDSKLEHLKTYLLENMQKCEITKITSPQFEISLRKKPASVIIYQEDLLPKEFLRTKTIVEPDKISIKDALTKGNSVAGAKLSETSYTLSIK
ncbi:MAG: hypothetical protein AMQ22_00700 [Candidatus Methanofastidiosum methylothiophilum]|uniref:Siphovirus Gp157 n=1 Tax=Candidatus Methanofastidiosum methylothiophilum TaxID=1705564 RepID=A0A150J621_9EURY|nr:MAG: hypothetical protein AMQ22_00700 [Candidatus Methanofastidiosum methylthiophilus]